MVLTSCDEHEPIDLDIHPGYILCSDGQIVSPSVFNSDVHTPVAVVFAEKTDKHQALAVLLDEIAPVAFADTLSFDQKTSGIARLMKSGMTRTRYLSYWFSILVFAKWYFGVRNSPKSVFTYY